ncbi:unnamed protein product [Vicia faba]|uniref:Uncharacterized protein n=1 Tax=Vicia faba TaxID=3906 RepID=A0AAV1A1J9_VICFA|nr:unnamed protein product [Vicia faba]
MVDRLIDDNINSFSSNTYCRVHNDRRTSFWNSCWLVNQYLNEAYLDIFELAENPFGMMAENEAFFLWSSNIKLALRNLWDIKASTRILIFGWRLNINRLPTRDHLAKRGVVVSIISSLSNPHNTHLFCVLNQSNRNI